MSKLNILKEAEMELEELKKLSISVAKDTLSRPMIESYINEFASLGEDIENLDLGDEGDGDTEDVKSDVTSNLDGVTEDEESEGGDEISVDDIDKELEELSRKIDGGDEFSGSDDDASEEPSDFGSEENGDEESSEISSDEDDDDLNDIDINELNFVDENDEAVISDVDDQEPLENSKDEVEESLSHTMTHSNARQAGSEGNVNYQKERNLRAAVRESEEKIKKLISTNNQLNKKINSMLKENASLKSNNAEFIEVLNKFRKQLTEMALVNSSTVYVNKLLVENAVTKNEKEEIFKKFSTLKTIDEMKDAYTTFSKRLQENAAEFKTSIVDVNVSGNASKNIIENVSYSKDSSISKILERMEYLDNFNKRN